MGSAGEISQLHNCFLIRIEIENSPVAEISLVNVYDMVTSTLLDNYRDTIREAIVQILKDTMWVSKIMIEEFICASFGIFEVCEGGMAVSLLTSSLQRFVSQSILSRSMIPIESIKIPLWIRFKSPDRALPTPPRAWTPRMMPNTSNDRLSSDTGPPSNVSETELLDQVSELPGVSPVLPLPVCTTIDVSAFVPGARDSDTLLAPDTATETTHRTAPGPVPGIDGENYQQDPGSMPDSGPTCVSRKPDQHRTSPQHE
jgi:hypothetical protein